ALLEELPCGAGTRVLHRQREPGADGCIRIPSGETVPVVEWAVHEAMEEAALDGDVTPQLGEERRGALGFFGGVAQRADHHTGSDEGGDGGQDDDGEEDGERPVPAR